MYMLIIFVTHNCIILVCIGVPLPGTTDSKSLEELETAKEVQKLGRYIYDTVSLLGQT